MGSSCDRSTDSMRPESSNSPGKRTRAMPPCWSTSVTRIVLPRTLVPGAIKVRSWPRWSRTVTSCSFGNIPLVRLPLNRNRVAATTLRLPTPPRVALDAEHPKQLRCMHRSCKSVPYSCGGSCSNRMSAPVLPEPAATDSGRQPPEGEHVLGSLARSTSVDVAASRIDPTLSSAAHSCRIARGT